jgi:hypothetical protein
VTRIFFTAMAARATNTGVCASPLGRSYKRIAIIAVGVTEIAISVHIVCCAVHLMFVITRKNTAFCRSGICKGTVTGITAIIIAFISKGRLKTD